MNDENTNESGYTWTEGKFEGIEKHRRPTYCADDADGMIVGHVSRCMNGIYEASLMEDNKTQFSKIGYFIEPNLAKAAIENLARIQKRRQMAFTQTMEQRP